MILASEDETGVKTSFLLLLNINLNTMFLFSLVVGKQFKV